jgi:hypothetical protein
MKKILTALLFISITLSAIADQVENPKAGLLSTVLDIEATEAIISGPLNGTDILYLRSMLLEHRLTSIDMSEARIVSGGKAYEGTNTTSNDVLGENMFRECGNLSKIILPKGLRRIGKCAFSRCNRLREIAIPDTVSVMGMDCLAYNNALRTVTIGRSVSVFEQGILWGSPAVTDIYMFPEVPPTYGNYTFGSRPRVHIHPDSERAYRNAWADLNVIFVTDLVDTLRVDYKAIAANLRTFFADDLFSEIATDYQSLPDEGLRSAMAAKEIPEDLQEIAVKIKNQQWARYEKQFRIHSYEPFSDANTWHSKLKATGLSYMGNPTGIWGKQGDILYVFVPEDVASDATLYIAGCTDNNLITNAKQGVELVKGMNVVKVTQEKAQFWIIYTVKTDNLKKKVTDWPNIDIHIEGGRVDGYYDITHASDEEYKYLRDHATYPLFTIRGRHTVWNFETPTYTTVWPKTIDNSITWSDNQSMWQFDLMGVTDAVAAGERDYPPYNLKGGDALYPSYCNNPVFSIQGDPADAGWANSTTYRTSYNGVDCVRASYDLENENFDSWCVAHECGHNNQGAFNLETCTEASNNLFSNVTLYLTGYQISKGKGIDYQSNDYNNNTPWVKRTIDSKMRMYYQLYLYYHMARRNTSFYPELIKELRRDPLSLWKNGDQSTLKFAEKVCKIANEDLTDFFESWGFFVPCTRVTVSDYGEYTYTITKRDIDDTRRKIAQYPRKNYEILFIEDRIQPTYRFDIWATGPNQIRSGYEAGKYGELGHFTDYMDSIASAQPTHYACAIIRDTVFVSGEGGVGFAAYNSDGSLRSFSNTRVLYVPNATTDTAWTAYSVTANGGLCSLDSLDEQHSDKTKEELMARLIQQANCVLQMADKEREVVGFYHYDDLFNLDALTREATEHYQSGDINSYVSYVHGLTDELQRLDTLERYTLDPGKDYIIRAARNTQYCITATQTRRQLAPSRSLNYRDKNKRFFFKVADEKAGSYYLCSRQNDNYVVNVPKDAPPTISNVEADAVPFALEERSPGLFAFHSLNADGQYIVLNSITQIYGGDYDSKNSLWMIVSADTIDTAIEMPKEECDENERANMLFDLSGRTIRPDATLSPGIYIMNGKKVLIR